MKMRDEDKTKEPLTNGLVKMRQRIAELETSEADRKREEVQIKASLKEKEVLLSQVHHKVMKSVQTMTSLLRLQAANIEEKKYADMFQDRLDRISWCNNFTSLRVGRGI